MVAALARFDSPRSEWMRAVIQEPHPLKSTKGAAPSLGSSVVGHSRSVVAKRGLGMIEVEVLVRSAFLSFSKDN